MIRLAVGALMMFAAGVPGDATKQMPRAYAQLTIRQQIIIRVPGGVHPVITAGNSLIQWRESHGPHCVSARDILGATMLGQNSVDLILRDNSRVRARLEERCPALDYYYGFYVNATQDGRICADRDAIRSRMGGQCGIDAFRTLRPIAGR